MTNRQADYPRLMDALGRQISYLRVSLTDNCNFRCKYCYGNKDSNSKHEKLTDDELIILIKAFNLIGVNKVRLTGGEPLLRSSIIDIIKRISNIPEIDLIGLTTNGYLLPSKINSLIRVGLTRLNVSIDSLDPVNFQKITGFDGLNRVLEGVELAERSGAFPWVKVNAVIMRGINDHEIKSFIDWGLNRKIDLRLIEYMPTQSTFWSTESYMAEEEMRQMIGMKLVPDTNTHDINGPARRYIVKGYPGRISFISAVSREFCGTCNRLRLTSSGELIGCLFRDKSVSLLPVLREKRTVEEIADFIKHVTSDVGFRRIPGANVCDFRPSMQAVGG